MAEERSLLERLTRVIEKQQEELSLIRQEIVHLDKRWATGAYDCECFDPDEFRRLQLDVEAIERRTRQMEKS